MNFGKVEFQLFLLERGFLFLKISCVILSLATLLGPFSCNVCDASSPKRSRTESYRVIKDKKKPAYREKKELGMFVKYLAAKNDKEKRERRKAKALSDRAEKK